MATDQDKDADQGGAETAGGSSEVAAVMEVLEECGIEDFDPRIIGMLVDTQMGFAAKLMTMADALAKHNCKQMVDANDVQAAGDILGMLSDPLPERQRMLQLAADRNSQPLPQIRHNFGLKLPNDRFCQLQQNVNFRSVGITRAPETTASMMSEAQLNDEQPLSVLRPEHVQNLLKRRADDDFDS